MKAVLQRVSSASVTCQDHQASIDNGFTVLVGFSPTDSEKELEWVLQKILKLKILGDSGKENIKEVGGALLVIPQFTLYANINKGNSPSFSKAASPKFAKELFNIFKKMCIAKVKLCGFGVFGADMKVTSTNEGPFTLLIEKEKVNN